MKVQKLFLFLLAVTVFSCSRESGKEKYSTIIEGQITVDQQLDSTGDFSGIELIASIRASNNNNNNNDTLFYAITDTAGRFSSTATFPAKDLYPLLISRNDNNFGIVSVVLAENDTIYIEGELPDIEANIEISSPENDVVKVFERVERSFSRVAQYMNAGAFSADTVAIEVNKWSNIYWDVYETYPGTYGAKLAGESSVAMLSGFNDSLMVARANELLQTYDTLRPVTRNTLLEYYAVTEGLKGALSFLEELKNRTHTESDLIELEMERIELLYDSSRTVQATQVLDQFKETFVNDSMALQWAEDMSYDLEFLAPGSSFPNLDFRLINGDSLNTEDLSGNPYLVEITRFDSPLYQQQFDRTVAIHQIYRNFGLQIITVPLATSNAMLEAFFEERGLYWNVVQPNSFDADELIERLNLNRLPTRFLVNSNGNIISRYIGEEYDEVVRGLQQITNQNEE